MRSNLLRKLYQIRRTKVALDKRDAQLSAKIKELINEFGPVECKNLLATIGMEQRRYISEKKIIKIGGMELLKKVTAMKKIEWIFISNLRGV